jgi:hypothetical protein
MILLITLICAYTQFPNLWIKNFVLQEVAICKMARACNVANPKQIKEPWNSER